MANFAGYGGTLTFTGQSAVTCRSVTINWERASLDVTLIGDYRERRAPGRIRRFGTITLFRGDGTIDATLRSHLQPVDVPTAQAATLGLKYVDHATVTYGNIATPANNIAIQITSAVLTDDGTSAAIWELTWEEQ